MAPSGAWIDGPTVIRGAEWDRNEIRSTTDPSGFDRLGFTDDDVNALCTLVQNLLHTLLAAAPRPLRSLASETLPPLQIYATRSRLGRLSFEWHASKMELHQSGTTPLGSEKWLPTRVRLCDINGLLLQCTPQQVYERDPELLAIIVHELIHLLFIDGVATSNVFNEACTLALQERSQPSPGFYGTNLPWDHRTFRGDTGFRTSDFATFELSSQAKRAFYIATTHALDDVPSETIWQICTALNQRAHQAVTTADGPKKYHPLWRDIEDAVTGELGSANGKAVLEQLALRPMTPGEKTMVFPQREGDQEVLRFRVFENAAYGERDRAGGWKGTQFLCEESPGPLLGVRIIHGAH